VARQNHAGTRACAWRGMLLQADPSSSSVTDRQTTTCPGEVSEAVTIAEVSSFIYFVSLPRFSQLLFSLQKSTLRKKKRQIDNMKFTDCGPIVAILDLLFDGVRALRPSWFTKAHPLSEKEFRNPTVVLARLDGNAGNIARDVRSMQIVLGALAPCHRSRSSRCFRM